MKKHLNLYFTAALLLAAALGPAPARADDDAPANALMLMPSENMAFDTRFQDFLNKNGARFTQSFPPYAFIGHVPEAVEEELSKKYGVKVYRAKVDDMADFFKCGASAVLAGNAWNKTFQDDPPVAPIVISHKVTRGGDVKLTLHWNEIMKAVSYRLQISPHRAFDKVALETVLAANSFDFYTPFWADGVYYWRVAGLLTLNTGAQRESDFSDTYYFSVSGSSAPALTVAPALPVSAKFKGSTLKWPKNPAFKYYRLQVAQARDFSAPLVDIFTSTESCKVAGLPLQRDTPYYMRLMGADNTSAGPWSKPSEIVIEAPGPSAKDQRKRRLKRRQ